jgi:hypothetical protein
MRLLKRYQNLSASERRLFFLALFLVLVIRAALWTLPFRVTRTWMERFRKPDGDWCELDRRSIRQVTWAVQSASRRIPRATCLTQAMATQVLLGRLGQDSELHLGVARSPRGHLEAHAWIEAQGRIILGDAVVGFQRYSRLKKIT